MLSETRDLQGAVVTNESLVSVTSTNERPTQRDTRRASAIRSQECLNILLGDLLFTEEL